MKILAGFYQPAAGELLLDGAPVVGERYEYYRSLITAIFPDFHLFQRLYGIDEPDPAELVELLTQFKLQEKTRLSHGEFQTTDLSSGQRRRLALIVAQLEKRPILMLDEWAADQDPEFRRKFYFEFLPELHRAGITVVAISHDDRYIDEMDVPIRRLRMDEGRFTELSSVETG
jgi:putative pyoverdin transport system ATP-binding/permease protein